MTKETRSAEEAGRACSPLRAASVVAAGIYACSRAGLPSPAERIARANHGAENTGDAQTITLNPGGKDAALYGRQGCPPLPSLRRLPFFVLCLLILLSTTSTHAQTTAFTYQGVLTENGAPANGVYDFEFTLKDAAVLGNSVVAPVTANDVSVTNGQFTATLDYGSGVFGSNVRWLAIGVRPGASAGAYTNLLPRQAITSAPYAIYAAGAAAAGLTGTLPSAALAGTYSGALNLNNGANSYSGSGAGLSALNASQLATGVVPEARLSANVSLLGASIESSEITDGTILNTDINATAAIADTKLATIATTGKVANSATTATNSNTPNTIVLRDGLGGFVAGSITASNLFGNGSGLTSLNASQLASGTVSSARLSGTYGNALTLNNAANSFSGSGAGLSALNASQLASGVVPEARLSANVSLLGSSIESSELTDGTILNADINAAAAIADTKLATLSTVGKVANSATTANTGNAPNTIVLRDGSGGFTAGTITASNLVGGGAGLTALNASQLASGTVPDARLAANLARTNQVWLLGGNTGTTPGSQFIGTTDNQPLEFRVSNQRALRIASATNVFFEESPNLVGGHAANIVSNGFVGAFIGGGGGTPYPNRVGNNFASVVGGRRNTASGRSSTAMGYNTTASGDSSTAMGISTTASGDSSTAMGNFTTASGSYSTAMGNSTTASGDHSTAMGYYTTASGDYSTAMGYYARALYDGSFVWADRQFNDFDSTGTNQFLIRASGGVGINTKSPAANLDVNGSIRVGSGGTVIQRIQSGQAELAGGSATARTNLTITFPTAFTTPPKILLSAANDPGWDVDDTFAVSARRVTTTNCVVNIMRVDQAGGWSQWLRVNWQAWE